MPTYVYENSNGERMERIFPIGSAPQKIGLFRRIVTFPTSIQFKGQGWASTAGKERFKVSWEEVEKINKESDRKAKENEAKKENDLKNRLLDST